MLEFDGEHYQVPYRGDGATGLGKPLKLMARPLRDSIPIYLASLRPKSVALAAEIADGWLPIFFSPERARATFPEPFAREGLEIAPRRARGRGRRLETGRDALRPYYALYVGGMGARGANFYNDLARAYGFEAEAEKIQDLFLEGRQRDAAAAVPDQLIDEMALVGPPERIRERLAAWRESGATELLISTLDPATLRDGRGGGRVTVRDLFDLSGRVAIVTGGGKGIGLQMATGLAELGADLLLCARKSERCEAAAEELSRGVRHPRDRHALRRVRPGRGAGRRRPRRARSSGGSTCS